MSKKKSKKRSGSVDRIEEGVVVVVTPDPKNPGHNVEVYIPEEEFQDPPEEGDDVDINVDD